MRAIEFITEVFKPGKTNWKWSRLGSNEAAAFFNVGDREYLWQAFTGRGNPKKWEIQFRLVRKPDVDPDKLDMFGKTGTGSSAEVMSTAVDITRAFLKEYGLDNVEEITFNAKEDSRIGLYAKMIKRLLPDWDLYSKKDPVDGMVFTLTDRRAYDKPENKLSEDEPIRLKLNNNNAAKQFIEKVYAKYPYTMQNNHVMVWGKGDDQQFAMFELTPSFSKRGAVEVKWIQAYPLRQGVGTRAMQELQAMAREDGISLTLFPWDKGQVSQSKLTKFYRGQGFKPTVKGGKAMQWEPQMRAIEFEAIEKLPAGEYRGGKSSLYHPRNIKAEPAQPLPGGSGFVYTIGPGQYGTEIKIWDPKGQDYINSTVEPVRKPKEPDWKFKGRLDYWKRSVERAGNTPGQLIGKLIITPADTRIDQFPLANAVRVEVITVDEDYRGRGIAKALYGIVLTIMQVPLVAGTSQTAGGRQMWVSLASIPGVEIKGYVGLETYDLNSRNIDTVMGQLGGEHLGQAQDGERFFTFDVQPNSTGKELEAYVKTSLSKIYGSGQYNSGLYATWSGA
jgi:GNAT superfamily N-acetyltransferase